jgi:hypothetical protein
LLKSNGFDAGYKKGYNDARNDAHSREADSAMNAPGTGPPPAKRKATSSGTTRSNSADTFSFPTHAGDTGTRYCNSTTSSGRGSSTAGDRFDEGVAYGKKVGYCEAEKALEETGNEKFFKGVKFALAQCQLQLSVCDLWEQFKLKASELDLGLDDTFSLLSTEKEVISID